MGETTKIEWCDHTFNPWRGCSKVHTGCANCYAEKQAKRNPGTLGIWGDSGTRVVASEDMWKQPLKWDKAAAKAGVRKRVFCASFADVFEDWNGPMVSSDGTGRAVFRSGEDPFSPETMADVRARVFMMIDSTPNLDWLLVTKRPENVRRMWPFTGTDVVPPPELEVPFQEEFKGKRFRNNVWLLTSVSDQATADAMIPELLKCRDLVPVLGVSAEPLLGVILLNEVQWDGICEINTLTGKHGVHRPLQGDGPHLDWVIVGGESGPKARGCNQGWIQCIVDQCHRTNTACFVKQIGAKSWVNTPGGKRSTIMTNDPKGGDPAEWPETLRVRQFPRIAISAK